MLSDNNNGEAFNATVASRAHIAAQNHVGNGRMRND
jgi:hypothetical protein